MTTKREMQYPETRNMDAQLESVLDAYASSEPGPSQTTLVAWIREYPQFARELMEFTAKWQMLEWADEMPPAGSEEAADIVSDDNLLFLRGMSAAQGAFYALRARRQATQAERAEDAREIVPSTSMQRSATISSLLAAAKQVGLSFVELRDRINLSDALLRKLDRRLIDPRSIPFRVMSDLAAALEHRIESVAAYLASPPAFAAGAQHRANQAPVLPASQQDFFDAVRNDAALSAEQKLEILALPRPSVIGTSLDD